MPATKRADPRVGLPPVWPASLRARIRRAAAGRSLVVLDDDPTGTQTVRDVPVLIDPSVDEFVRSFVAGTPVTFVLTNSRSLPAGRAATLARTLGRRIARAAKRTGRPISVVSRSDSTLRGHFPAEVDPLLEALGWPDAPVLLMPYLGDAGRITIDDTHYVVREGEAVPVAETEYATDSAFAYADSNLRRWVAARPGTAGRAVASLPLELIRGGGPAGVEAALSALEPRSVCIVNAAEDRDAEVVAAATLALETSGTPILVRSAAGFLRARAGQARAADLSPAELPLGEGPGLIVVGSHVPATTRQLQRLLADPPLELELVDIPAAQAADPAAGPRIRRRAAERVGELLHAGVTPVVATSRERLEAPAGDPSGVVQAARISRTLIGAVRSLPRQPAWVLAKGGITSSDVATVALGTRSALVLGQLLPGVPVWRVDGGRYPGVVLVVFPGNVGDDGSLRAAVTVLARRARP
jgi:uncharacterized protein YgbK (DUF1537 family)